MSSVQAGVTTFAEFLAIPDPPAGHYELHHGEVVLMPPRKRLHAKIQQVLSDLLSPLVRGRGFMTIEFPFCPAPEYEAWQADVAFVAKDRWEKDDADYFSGAPDLVIEVLSASNTMDEILDRQDVCLSNGCTAFWTVDPKRRLVLVTTPDRKTVTFDRSMSILLPEPLSGTIPVAAIFA
jgi:Uma2 family endonuclease